MSEAEPREPEEESTPPAEADREAILRRRKRFIATALSGLAASAATGCPQPQPCLKVQASPTTKSSSADGKSDKSGDVGEGSKSDSVPRPCLSAVHPDAGKTLKPEEPAPRPCLSVQAPDSGETKTRPPAKTTKKTDSKPQPCLRVRKAD
jgi:hypothetical protein